MLTVRGVLLIGLTNLALWIGLKARGADYSQRLALARVIAARLLTRPRGLFLAPAEQAHTKENHDCE